MPYGGKRTPIGQRRERITIRQRVTTDDGLGGQVELRKAIVAEPWAKVEALDERTHEGIAGGQLMARHGYLLEIPYRTGIVPRLIVNVRDTTMEIHTVTDDEGLKRRLLIQAREVQ